MPQVAEALSATSYLRGSVPRQRVLPADKLLFEYQSVFGKTVLEELIAFLRELFFIIFIEFWEKS